MSLCDNLLKYRKFKNLTAEELAQLVGVTQSYISKIEKNKGMPTVDVLQRIAKALDVTVSELLGETSNEMSDELRQLILNIKDLDPNVIQALTNFIDTFKTSSTKVEEIKKDVTKNINFENKDSENTIPKVSHNPQKSNIRTLAAHYEGTHGLTDEDMQSIEDLIKDTKRLYNPDGTPKK